MRGAGMWRGTESGHPIRGEHVARKWVASGRGRQRGAEAVGCNPAQRDNPTPHMGRADAARALRLSRGSTPSRSPVGRRRRGELLVQLKAAGQLKGGKPPPADEGCGRRST
jgi:hypothetical protein